VRREAAVGTGTMSEWREKDFSHYRRLAELFVYPSEGFARRVRRVQAELDSRWPAAGAELRPFTELVSSTSSEKVEELYVRTFDVQAATSLDIGYVLFGEDYKRGVLLVHLNEEHTEAGLDCGGELADHLPNVLRLVGTTEKTELRLELVRRILVPALTRMIEDLTPARIREKNKQYRKEHRALLNEPEGYGVAYRHALRALCLVLERDFGLGGPEEHRGRNRGEGERCRRRP